MTKLELAQAYLYDLYNDADHAAKLADEARHALGSGDVDGALGWLDQARRPVGLIEMRLNEAIRSAGEARATPSSERERP